MGLRAQNNQVAKTKSHKDIIIAPQVEKESRPPCPKCGSVRIWRRGNFVWICADCGKQWLQNLFPKTDRTGRPVCPICGLNKNVNKKGRNQWFCTSCCKWWVEKNESNVRI